MRNAQQFVQASPTPATVSHVMRSPLTTVEQRGHVAAAAYLMKHAGETALMVLDTQTDQPIGIITEADVAHAVADGKDMNRLRVYELMTIRPTVITRTTSVRDAANLMASGHFRHLPIVDDAGLAGIVDISDVCRALPVRAGRVQPPGPCRRSRSAPVPAVRRCAIRTRRASVRGDIQECGLEAGGRADRKQVSASPLRAPTSGPTGTGSWNSTRYRTRSRYCAMRATLPGSRMVRTGMRR
jgi:CBS domain-containing protein